MKILRLPAYFIPEQMASTHLQIDRLEAFSALGVDVVVYTPTPTRGLSDEEFKFFRHNKQESLYNGHVQIHRFPMYREGCNPALRALRYILTNFIQYNKGIHEEDIDVIYSSSTPPTQGVLCGCVKKTLSKKYGRYVPIVYNLQDIFPDSLVNAKMTHEGSLLWKIGRKVEDFTYRNADKIIVISEGFKRNIMAKGVPEEKIVVIPNWIDTEKVHPISRDQNPLFEKYNLDREKFYICYSGNVGHSQNLELLLETAKVLQETLAQVHFVIVGEGAAKAGLEAAVNAEHLSNVTLLPFQPYEDIAKVFSLGDADLIISKPGIGGSSVPSKTWGIMASKTPVLASFDEDSELSKLVKELGCGIAVPAGDQEALISAITNLVNNRSATSEMGRIGREYVMENLNKEKCTGMYVDVITMTVEEK